MEIVKASKKDLKEIVDICKDCSQNLANNLIDQWDEIYPNEQIFFEDIRNNSLYIASYNPKEIAACIVLNENQDPEYSEVSWKYNSGKNAVIHRLMVHPYYEGKGIARKLVDYIEILAKEKQYNSIRLDVFANNPRAISFYQRLSYQLAGQVNFRKGLFFCYEKPL